MMLGSMGWVAGLWVSATSAVTPDLQLAVVFDATLFVETGPARLREVAPQKNLMADLMVAESWVNKKGGQVQFAMVDCEIRDRQVVPRTRLDFKHRKEGVAATPFLMATTPPKLRSWCAMNADVLGHAVTALRWHPQAQRRILVLSRDRATVEAGRRTFSEVMGDALHHRVAVHVLTYSENQGQPALQYLMQDIERFMTSPTQPLGRTIQHWRHGARWTGGSYFASVVMDTGSGGFREPLSLHAKARRRRHRNIDPEPDTSEAPDPEAIRAQLRAAWNLEATYGESWLGEMDVLEALARGRLRPSQVSVAQYPEFLVGVNLEPLLDAVWDFVHARASVERILSSVTADKIDGKIPPAVGYALGRALLAPPQHPPSRR